MAGYRVDGYVSNSYYTLDRIELVIMLFLFQVHDMMDDIAEQQDVAKEISEAISNPVAFGGVSSYL